MLKVDRLCVLDVTSANLPGELYGTRIPIISLIIEMRQILEIRRQSPPNSYLSLAILSLIRVLFQISDFGQPSSDGHRAVLAFNNIFNHKRDNAKGPWESFFTPNIEAIAACAAMLSGNRISPFMNLVNIIRDRLGGCPCAPLDEDRDNNLLLCFAGFLILRRVSPKDDSEKEILKALVEYGTTILAESDSPLALKACKQAIDGLQFKN